MRKFLKNYGALTLIFLFLFVGSWQLIGRFYDKQVTEQQISYLQKKGELLLRLSSHNTTKLKNLADSYVANSHERITILDEKGDIIFDSYDSKLTGTRSNRPEIQAVMKGNPIGTSIRQSNDLNERLLYVSLPIIQEKQASGYLRLAEPADEFVKNAETIRDSIFLIYLLFYSMVYIFVIRLLRKRNRPIETIVPILRKMVNEPSMINEPFIYEKTQSDVNELYSLLADLNNQIQETHLAYTTSERQLSTLLNELMIGVFIIDRNGDLKMINTSMQKYLITGKITKLNVHFAQFITDTQLIQLIYHVNEHTPFVHQEIRLQETNRVLDITLRYFKEDNQILATAYDLTKIRRLEKLQRDFVGNVTHELKTPVTSLIGFTETLLDGAKDDPEVLEQFLLIIQKDAQRLESLIHQVIQLSKMDDMYNYELKNIPFFDFIKHIQDGYTVILEKKNMTIEIDGSEDYLLYSKQELIDSILKNLIENAIHYSSSNTNITIRFYEEEQHHFILQVSDQGIGIDPDEQERIFERFYRVDKARTRNSGGSGLGLAIVKEYVEVLGGTISLESHLGLGTTFTIRLPFQ